MKEASFKRKDYENVQIFLGFYFLLIKLGKKKRRGKSLFLAHHNGGSYDYDYYYHYYRNDYPCSPVSAG